MNVDEILAPIPRPRFFDEIWERRPLHVRREAPGYYDELLTMADIEDELLGNRNLAVTSFKVYRGKEELDPLHWSDRPASGDRAASVVSPPKLLAALRQGYSVYVSCPERIFPRVGVFLVRAGRELEVRATSHLIISAPGSQGFLPHSDPYGVLVLQLSGAKVWRSYGVRDRPPSGQGVNHHHLAPEPPTEAFEVSAGDLLYLPRGTAHAAATAEAHSIHLSVAFVPPRGVDVMRLIEGVAEQQGFFQEYVPCGTERGRRAAYARRFKDRLIELIEGADLFELLDRRLQTIEEGARSAHPLRELFEVEEVDVATRVRVRAGLRYDLRLDGETDLCRLAFGGVTLDFPGRWHPGLEALFATREFPIRALGETLSIADLDRVQVAKNLLHAGFLEL